MIIFKTDFQLLDYLKKQKQKNKTIGFVPTMGALHEGHIQLLKEAIRATDISIVSIFVNPTQFNNTEDLKKYPVTTGADINLLEKNGCHILYLPSVEVIYPTKANTQTSYEIGDLENLLEGAFRPGHYKGVVQVVNILLKTVLPDLLFLGAKDFQQCLILTQFAAKHFPNIKVIKIETVRAVSGLALSSRNKRLTEGELETAPIIFSSLKKIKENFKKEEFSSLTDTAKLKLAEKEIQTEYLVIADATKLETVETWDGQTKLVALVAANLGSVRLIDNLELN